MVWVVRHFNILLLLEWEGLVSSIMILSRFQTYNDNFSTSTDVGKSKSECAAKRLSQHNPNIQAEPHTKRLSQKNITEIFKMYDVIIDGSDNFETRYLVNDACVILGKPLVFGAIFKFSGQLSVFNFENGPTYRCLFPNPPGPDALPPCGEAGVGSTARHHWSYAGIGEYQNHYRRWRGNEW